MKLDSGENLLCGNCKSEYMYNFNEYILTGRKNRGKFICIITKCEECEIFNSYSFYFNKGTIYFSHNYGAVVEKSISENGNIYDLLFKGEWYDTCRIKKIKKMDVLRI